MIKQARKSLPVALLRNRVDPCREFIICRQSSSTSPVQWDIPAPGRRAKPPSVSGMWHGPTVLKTLHCQRPLLAEKMWKDGAGLADL